MNAINTAFLHLSHHLLSPSPFKCMSASFCPHSLMKVAVCYQNVGITTVTFLASANESLVKIKTVLYRLTVMWHFHVLLYLAMYSACDA